MLHTCNKRLSHIVRFSRNRWICCVGKDGVTRPGKGKVVKVVRREYSERELEAMAGKPSRYRSRFCHDARHLPKQQVTNMTRRIAALILMESELNENYQRVKMETFSIGG